MYVSYDTTAAAPLPSAQVSYAPQRRPQYSDFLSLSAPDAVAHCLAELYQFKDQASVTAFLRNHLYLANTLLPALSKARQYFGESTQVVLEVVQDPEDGDRKLFAFILTPLPVAEALAKRDQFDNEWWLDACDQTQGQLIFDVEFI